MCLQVGRRQWLSPCTKLVLSMTQKTVGPCPCFQSCLRPLKGWCIGSWWHIWRLTSYSNHWLSVWFPTGELNGDGLAFSNWAHPAGHRKKQLSLLCLFDLSKAFDCVPHDRLLQTLRSLGIEQPWFSSYLKGRTHVVEVGSTLSETKPVNCGVPQWSILGPVLFILHTINVPRAIKESSEDTAVAAYADDTQTVDQFSKPQLQEQLAKSSKNIAHTQDSYTSRLGLRWIHPKPSTCSVVLAGIRRDLEPEINAQGESLAWTKLLKTSAFCWMIRWHSPLTLIA